MKDLSPVEPHCTFCRSNGILKGEVTAETDSAYLIEAAYGSSNYLIIPTDHIESISDLPDNWWVDVKTLVPKIPNLLKDYNLSFNIGGEAGQTLKHLHLWVIPREADQPASHKGLARLIEDVNSLDSSNQT